MANEAKHDNCRACTILNGRDLKSLPLRKAQDDILDAVARYLKQYPLRLKELRACKSKAEAKEMMAIFNEQQDKNLKLMWTDLYSLDGYNNKSKKHECTFAVHVKDRPIEFWNWQAGYPEKCLEEVAAQLQHLYGFEASVSWTVQGKYDTDWTYYVTFRDTVCLYDNDDNKDNK